MGTREENLRATLFTPHIIDIGANAITGPEGFAWQRFVTPHNAFTTAKVNDDVAIFSPLHGAVDDFANTVLKFVIHAVTFGIAHLLHNHLLGRLRGDATELDGRQRLGDIITDLRRRVFLRCFFQGNLSGVILNNLSHHQQPVESGFAGLRINLGANFILNAVSCLCSTCNCVFHGFQHDGLVDGFFTRHGICDLQKFKPVGTDCSISHCRFPLRRRLL